MQPLHRNATAAIATFFLLNALSYASLAARLPEIKAALQLSNSGLGMVLFTTAWSAVVSVKVSGYVTSRFGSKPVMVVTGVGMALAFPALMTITTLPVFVVTAIVMIVFVTSMDVAMNAHAVAVEHASGRMIMSRMHAAWSVGGIVGGGIGAACAASGVSLSVQGLALGALTLVSVLMVQQLLLDASVDRREHTREKKQRHKGPTIFVWMGVMALAAAVTEGTAVDWGAVLLRDTWRASAGIAALAYVAFQSGMVLGRFNGDLIAAKWGRARTLIASSVLSCAGLLIAILIGGIWPSIVGWLVLGLGVSVVMPTVFGLAGSIAASKYAGKVTPSEAVGTVSSLGYSAFFIGPPMMGFLADAISLRWALLAPALLAISIAALTPRIAADEHLATR